MPVRIRWTPLDPHPNRPVPADEPEPEALAGADGGCRGPLDAKEPDVA